MLHVEVSLCLLVSVNNGRKQSSGSRKHLKISVRPVWKCQQVCLGRFNWNRVTAFFVSTSAAVIYERNFGTPSKVSSTRPTKNVSIFITSAGSSFLPFSFSGALKSVPNHNLSARATTNSMSRRRLGSIGGRHKKAAATWSGGGRRLSDDNSGVCCILVTSSRFLSVSASLFFASCVCPLLLYLYTQIYSRRLRGENQFLLQPVLRWEPGPIDADMTKILLSPICRAGIKKNRKKPFNVAGPPNKRRFGQKLRRKRSC